MSALYSLTISETLEALGNKACSSEEVTQAYLNRIDTTDDQIGAFLHLDREHPGS
ncbi:MAG: hypothetical protein ACO37D_04770 [Rhodothermales bacterium]